MSFFDNENVKVINVSVDENNLPVEDSSNAQNLGNLTDVQQKPYKESKKKNTEEKNYGWAFFLCSLFIGAGLSGTFDSPFFATAGLGIGFLFFVKPIYEKVMDKINKW